MGCMKFEDMPNMAPTSVNVLLRESFLRSCERCVLHVCTSALSTTQECTRIVYEHDNNREQEVQAADDDKVVDGGAHQEL